MYVSSNQKQLKRVPARGGLATVLWTSDSLALYTVTPLPGARGVVFQGCQKACSDASLWTFDLRTGSAKALRHDGWGGYYFAPGYLAYVSEGDKSLLVAPFDARSLEIRGTPMVVLDSITMRGVTPYLAISLSGTLVMVRAAETQNGEFELVWVDRSGRESAVDTTFTFRVTQVAGNYGMALSPDETRLAIGRNTPDGDDIWIKSLPRGPATRLTFKPESESRPRWTADGRALTFVALTGFYLRRADGAGGDSLLWRGVPDEGALSPDGQWLVIRAGSMGPVAGGRDIFGIRRGSDVITPLVASEFDEAAFTISPNGRWIAYHSLETGRPEVFVRPFPSTGDAKVQISSDGGQAPLWSRDGSELFYLRADSTMMAIAVLNGREWRGGEPRALFKLSNGIARLEPEYYTPWEVARDGRFLFARMVRGEDIRRSPLIVVENWVEELKVKVPR